MEMGGNFCKILELGGATIKERRVPGELHFRLGLMLIELVFIRVSYKCLQHCKCNFYNLLFFNMSKYV